MKHAKAQKRGSKVKATLFFGALLIAMVFSLILPLRPKFSPVEKRELTKFPEFSVSSLLSGKFFHGIDSWFSDTFPARDTFFKINDTIRSAYGFNKTKIHGTVEKADDIPDAPFTGN